MTVLITNGSIVREKASSTQADQAARSTRDVMNQNLQPPETARLQNMPCPDTAIDAVGCLQTNVKMQQSALAQNSLRLHQAIALDYSNMDEPIICQMNRNLAFYADAESIYEGLKKDHRIDEIIKNYKKLIQTERKEELFVIFAFNMIDRLLSYPIHDLMVIQTYPTLTLTLLGFYIGEATKLILKSLPISFKRLQNPALINDLKRIAAAFAGKLQDVEKLIVSDEMISLPIGSNPEYSIGELLDELSVVKKQIDNFITQLEARFAIETNAKTRVNQLKFKRFELQTKTLFNKPFVQSIKSLG